MRRVADCKTHININRGSISSGIVSVSFEQIFTEKNLKKEQLQYQEKVVIDETTQCENCKAHKAKRMSCCTCGVILHELSDEINEKHAMIRSGSLQWRRGRAGGHAESLTPESLNYQAAEHHFRRAPQNKCEGCADSCGKDADNRLCMQENNRTYGKQQNDATAKAGALWKTSGMLLVIQLEDPIRYQSVDTLHLDKFTALA